MTDELSPIPLSSLSIPELEQRVMVQAHEEPTGDECDESMFELLKRGAQGDKEAMPVCVRLLVKDGSFF